MDALTQKAFEALLKDVLPRLKEHLEAVELLDADSREADDDCRYLIAEASELLSLLRKWSGGESTPDSPDAEATSSSATDEEMSDEDAQKLLAQMEGAEPQESSSEDMSDEEAQKLLASMDSDSESAPAAQADMSDADAQRLLAEMDDSSGSGGGAESDDESQGDEDEAMKMLAKLEGESGDDSGSDSESGNQGGGAVAVPEFAKEEVEEVEEFGKSEFSSDPEMIKDFIQNADELMENLDEQILLLEQSPGDKEIINEIFRSAHTLKGAAGMFAFRAMERIMHRMENYFDQIAKGKQQVTGDAVDVIFQSMDILKTLIGGIKEGSPTGCKTAPIVSILNQLCAGQLQSGASASVKAADTGSSGGGGGDAPKAPDAVKKEKQSTIRVDLQRLDALVNLVGELVIDRTRFSSIEEQLRMKGPHPQLAGNMSETVQLFGRHMNEVQDIIMKVRMVPIGNAFNKYTRIVRDLSKGLGKEIDLVIDGENTELDKTIVEEIGDPLIHLIRNSVDHGIEFPDERTAIGKKSRGKIMLSARQEGNQIMITIEDDGKGMAKEKIRQKGVEKGLISEDDSLSDRDIFALIFEPGFSTAEQVTNISGRGVGMDVVKKQISKLKGVIDIHSSPNVGTTISIQLPLTLAIVQSLLVKSKDEIFAIPLSAVVESIRIKPSDLQRVGESEVIKRRNRVLPLFHLHEALDLDQKENRFWYTLPKVRESAHERKRKKKVYEDRLFVVVVGTADRRFGLVVDSLLNQQEMVIKSMGNLMSDIPCVAGGAILGNGEVVLVLDIGELEEHFRSKSRVPQVA